MSNLLTLHAMHRQIERRVPDEHIELAVQLGRQVFAGGAVHYFMGRKEVEDLPVDLRTRRRLEGLVVVANASTERILTVYRNPNALRHIKRKQPYGYARPMPDRHAWRNADALDVAYHHSTQRPAA